MKELEQVREALKDANDALLQELDEDPAAMRDPHYCEATAEKCYAALASLAAAEERVRALEADLAHMAKDAGDDSCADYAAQNARLRALLTLTDEERRCVDAMRRRHRGGPGVEISHDRAPLLEFFDRIAAELGEAGK